MVRKTLRRMFAPLQWAIRFGLGGRSRGEKLLRRTWLVTFVTVFAIVPAIWVGFWARFALSVPAKQFDWVSRLNSQAEAASNDPAAWPVYEQAYALLRAEAAACGETPSGEPPGLFLSDERMEKYAEVLGAPNDRYFTTFVSENADAIGLLVEATSRRTLGNVHGDELERRLDATAADILWPRPRYDFRLQLYRQVLRKAFFGAVVAGDPGGAVDAMRALSGIAHHYRQAGPMKFDALPASMTVSLIAQDLSFVLLARPQLFSDGHLQELVDVLQDATVQLPDPKREEQRIDNVLDQMYSPGGILTIHGARMLGTCIDRTRTPPLPPSARHARWLHPLPGRWAERAESILVLPVATYFLPTREELRTSLLKATKAADALASRPVWQRADDVRELLLAQKTTIPKWRDVPQFLLRADRPLWWTLHDTAECRRETTLLLIRLELARREHGAWPKDLSALETSDIPNDPFADRPLQYDVRNGQPVIWSVGPDLIDQAGAKLSPFDNRHGTDWRIIPGRK